MPARASDNPILFVNFYANGQITMTLADGTSVGTTSGAPTVIPAGYYDLEFSGPGGCSTLPYFRLMGPNENIATNGNEGQVVHPPSSADFLPNASYTWSDDAFPGVVYHFSTSTQVVGTAPTDQPVTNTGQGPVSSQNVVGSEALPFVGSLSGTISASGKVALLHDGKSVTSLKPGRYTLNILSKAANRGFEIEQPKSKVVAIARGAFTGKRSISVSLTAGTWVLAATPGGTSPPFVVG